MVSGVLGNLLVHLARSRRAGCLRHRTSGLLMGHRSSRRLCTRYGRRPVPKGVDRLVVVRLAIPQRETHLVTRCDVTGQRRDQRLCPRQRQRRLGEVVSHRQLVWLDVHRQFITTSKRALPNSMLLRSGLILVRFRGTLAHNGLTSLFYLSTALSFFNMRAASQIILQNQIQEIVDDPSIPA